MDMQRWCGCATVEEGRGSESGGNGGNRQKVGGSLPRATAEVRVRVRVIASPTRVPLFQTLPGSLHNHDSFSTGILISRKRSWNCETVMSPAMENDQQAFIS